MTPRRPQLLIRLHKLLDLGLTAVAFLLAYAFRKWLLAPELGGLAIQPNYYIVLLLILFIWSQVFQELGLYESYRRKNLLQVYSALVRALGTAMVLLLLALYVLHIDEVSRLLLGLFLLTDLLLLLLSKGLILRALHNHLRRGFNIRHVLVIGSRQLAVSVITTMHRHEEIGYRIVGCLDPDTRVVGQEVVEGVKVIDTVERLPEILREQVVDEVIFAMRLKRVPRATKLIAAAETLGVTVRIVPDWQLERKLYDPNLSRVRLESFLGVVTMTISTVPPASSALHVKTILDYLFAAAALLLLSPLLLLIGAAIKLKSPGPVIFSQERCGLNGRCFPVFKFRTMVMDAEAKLAELRAHNEADGPVFKIRQDPRIIPWVGTFLRKTSLDELPQLFNILRGEMSLIGPRPPIPQEVEEYEPWQRRRLSMKPGITGLWQTSANRNDVSFEEWMALDLKYIDNWSLFLDSKIFFKTALVMITGMGR